MWRSWVAAVASGFRWGSRSPTRVSGRALRPRPPGGRPGPRGQDAVPRAGADEALERLLAEGRLMAITDPAAVARPSTSSSSWALRSTSTSTPIRSACSKRSRACSTNLRDGQHLILRSTIYPGVTGHGRALLKRHGRAIDVSFCPERIAEGKALERAPGAARRSCRVATSSVRSEPPSSSAR